MNWLSFHHIKILCYEKTVWLNLPNGDTMAIYGDKSKKNLKFLSCTENQKYLPKKCYNIIIDNMSLRYILNH